MSEYSNETILEILALVSTKPSESLESDTLDFKEFQSEHSLHNSKDIAEDISAFANKFGGVIIIGIRDSSKISNKDWKLQLVGFEATDPIEIKARLTGRISPPIDLIIRKIQFRGLNYLAIEIPRRQDTLVCTTSGKYYIRDGRSSRPMLPAEIQQAVKSLSTYDWTADPVDLDIYVALDRLALQEAKKDFCIRRGLDAELADKNFLEAIGATKDGVLTKGGLLFLGDTKIIRDVLGDYEFRFSWKTKSGHLEINEIWSSCLWHAINKNKIYFQRCNKIQEFIYKEKKFSAPLLDEVAFHEAFVNAVVHRDYATDGMVSVDFTGTKLAIRSPGKFYGGITSENIGLHEPRHRNKALARILMNHNLVDRAGMGVPRMSLGSLKYGRSFPKFRETTDTVEVSMDAQFIKARIAILALDNEETYGVPELLVLNCVHETGVISIADVEHKLSKFTQTPWDALQSAIETVKQVEFCGNSEGVFIRVTPQAKQFMEVVKLFNPSSNSAKHVALYKYLRKVSYASNTDISSVLGHKHSSQTSEFLRKSKYVVKSGNGSTSRWKLLSGK